jgi:hypothetical protein
MTYGWYNDIHYNLFSPDEVDIYLKKNALQKYFSSYQLVGLVGWDDFLLKQNNSYYTIPTVPIDFKYLSEFDFNLNIDELKNDKNITDKIKWYIKPLIFGGDPKLGENIQFIDLGTHAELIAFWNKTYCSLKNNTE